MKQACHLLGRLLIAAFAASAFISASVAADFPARRIEIVVPVTPGGATDLLARLLADKLPARLGQPVIVINKPGAAQQIGAEYVRGAAADGHTLLLFHSGIMANPVMFKAFKLDLQKDFTQVIQVASTPWVLAVHEKLPVRNMTELIAYAKANPSKVNFGSTGGTVELDIATLKRRARIDGEVLLYPGGTQVLAALSTNEIQFALNSVRGVQSFAGRGIRAIAVTSARRSSIAPNLPTIAESGVPGYKGFPLWYGIWGPAGMPQDVLHRLNAEFNAILKMPDVEKRIVEGMAHEVAGGTPKDIEAVVREELAEYRQAALEAGIEPK